MRIAVLAPPWLAVPPRRYGGTEAVVNLLVEGLVDAGPRRHAVRVGRLADAGASSSRRSTRSAPTSSARRSRSCCTRSPACARPAASTSSAITPAHPGWRSRTSTSTPFLSTVHGTLAGEAGDLYRRVCELTPDAALVSLTQSHRNSAPDLPWAATIPNAIALDDHPCRRALRRQVPLLARPHVRGQGPGHRDRGRARGRHAAAARRQAARPRRAALLRRRGAPRLGGGIAYVGEIDLHERVRLLHGAHALLNPLAWDEPFGLVMAEAMACGVPVIATPRGSVPEIVIPGMTGWIAETVDEMAAAVERCHEIDPSECRAHRRAQLHAGAHGGGLRGRLPRRHRARRSAPLRSPSARLPDHARRNRFRTAATGENGPFLPSPRRKARPCFR